MPGDAGPDTDASADTGTGTGTGAGAGTGTGFAQAVNAGIHPAAPPGADPEAARRDLLARLHAERTPLVARMDRAPDEAARRAAREELHRIDERYLQELARYPADHRYQHDREDVVRSAGAALQLRAAYNAEERLGHTAEGRRDAEGNLSGMRASVPGVAGGQPWCGAFANAQNQRAGMDTDLGRAFMHTSNAEGFFRYIAGPRNPGWIRVDGAWQPVRDYHAARHAERRWWDASAVQSLAVAPQPGDVVLIDHSGEAPADHVAMVHSYDPASHRLTLIDGNGGGFVVDRGRRHAPAAGRGRGRAPSAPAADPARDRVSAAAGGATLRRGGAGDVTMSERDLDNEPTAAQTDADVRRVAAHPGAPRQVRRIYGIGRLSPIDYEQHEYTTRDPSASGAGHGGGGRRRADPRTP